MIDTHAPFVTRCFELAFQGRSEGGLPIGSVLVSKGRIIGEGYNRRVQQGDPIAHGEMDCLRNGGRRPHYRDTILYTSLSPCMMCAGTIVQFGIPHVVIAENRIGYVYARDGEPLSPANTLGRVVPCGNFQDTQRFLSNGGQRGRQRDILREGVYAINLAQFVVITEDRIYSGPASAMERAKLATWQNRASRKLC
jgi:tRNA(Arg) A34 adenosine deaminase TadA